MSFVSQRILHGLSLAFTDFMRFCVYSAHVVEHTLEEPNIHDATHMHDTHVCRTKAGASEGPLVMGRGQNAFEYTKPRPVNPKKKPPLFQNQKPHINIFEPPSPTIQC